MFSGTLKSHSLLYRFSIFRRDNLTTGRTLSVYNECHRCTKCTNAVIFAVCYASTDLCSFESIRGADLTRFAVAHRSNHESPGHRQDNSNPLLALTQRVCLANFACVLVY
jgi:hypothetical protein